MSLADQFKALIQQLPAPGRPSPTPAEIKQLLSQLLQLLDELPRDTNPLYALKKAGAWRDKPIAADAERSRIHVKAPCSIEFTNVPTATLRAQIHAHPHDHDEHGNAEITIKPLLG